jgi:hypothetical protein
MRGVYISVSFVDFVYKTTMSQIDEQPSFPSSSCSTSAGASSSRDAVFTISTIKYSLINDHLHYQVITNNNKRRTANKDYKQAWLSKESV